MRGDRVEGREIAEGPLTLQLCLFCIDYICIHNPVKRVQKVKLILLFYLYFLFLLEANSYIYIYTYMYIQKLYIHSPY